MTPLPPADASAAPAAPETALVAAFEHRILTRDEPVPPVPLCFDAASVRARLSQALRTRLAQRDPRRLRALAHICHGFLAAPTQLSTDPELADALGLSSSGITRTWQELRESGLIEQVPAGRRRCYRLSRPGEDWLLAVVKGDPQP